MGLYAYALVAGRGASAPLGLGAFGEPLRRSGWLVTGARAKAPRSTAAAVRAQLRVVQRLAGQFPAILPFRFGSYAPSLASLHEGLSPQSALLKRALRQVRGCSQMTVELSGRTRPAPRRAPTRDGRGYLAHAQAVHRWSSSAPELVSMRQQLRALVRSERVVRSAAGLRVYHLVPRASVDAYRAVWSEVRLPGIRIRVSGPHPPFAFAPEASE